MSDRATFKEKNRSDSKLEIEKFSPNFLEAEFNGGRGKTLLTNCDEAF